MRVLFVTPYLGASYGGTSKVVVELAMSLGQHNVSVDVISTNANDGKTLNVELQTWITCNGYRVQYFSAWHKSDLVLSSTMFCWLFQHIKDYDLVHTHTLFSPLITLTHSLCSFFRKPYIITPHGMLEPWALAYKAWKKKLYYAQFEQPALSKAKAIQVLSKSEKEQVSKLGFSQVVLVPNGIHQSDFKGLPDAEVLYQRFPKLKDKQLILFLGRIDPKKGLDLLAHAFSNVHQYCPNTHLIVAGPDSIGFMSTVKRYFADAGCLDAVTFTGMLSGNIKYSALAAADIYVSPSYSEGFSMSVLEGMAAGLPCVITENCNFPEAAEANAALVVSTNKSDVADALLTCLHDYQKAQKIGNLAQRFIFQNYTWEQVSKKLMVAYENII